jgi:hypothetical protein
VGSALLLSLGFTGPAVGPQADGAVATCDSGQSAARVIRGKDGIDPNSVTAAEARGADARLQKKVDRLIRQHVLNSSGWLNNPRQITIPTHVHVITASDGSGGVTAQQIRDQIQVMNDAFAGRTSSQSTRTPFALKLASVDVTANDAWFNWGLNDDGTETSDAIAAKNALHRGGWNHLNLYVAALGDGLLGYATFPTDGVLALDGVVLLNDSLPGGSAAPYNEGDTATHEVGHWLGLYHTFENGCHFPGDYVSDTPYQFDGENIFYCNEDDDTCRNFGKDPVHNFMSYGDDPCLDRFTRGQDQRMIQTWMAFRN